MKSMTGYGSSRMKNRQLEIEVHVKSVNGRFLETRFHLPKEYSPFENEMRKTFAEEWARGTVDVYIHRRPAQEDRLQTVTLRRESARHWAEQLRSLAIELKLSQDIHLRDLLQMPFVMEHQDRVALLPNELQWVNEQIVKAADLCQKMRLKEGLMLKKELLTQLKNLESCVKQMDKLRDEAIKGAGSRIKARLAHMESEQPLDDSRLALETALLIDKMDVHEELVRLIEHVKACRQLIQTSESAPLGKKLDFYCQELLREVNTVGSKSQLAALTQVVVQAKSVIEKFREQVQNIE